VDVLTRWWWIRSHEKLDIFNTLMVD